MYGLERDQNTKGLVPLTHPTFESFASSKFNGIPFIPDNEKWPTCECCSKPLRFMMQVNSSDLPDTYKDHIHTGLMQFFFCSNDSCEVGNDPTPFSKGHLIRHCNTFHPPAPYEYSSEYEKGIERTIVGWDYTDDLDGECHIPDDVPDNKKETKPCCSICNKEMTPIFSLESHGNLDYGFGDLAVGKLYHCEVHKDVTAFSWDDAHE